MNYFVHVIATVKKIYEQYFLEKDLSLSGMLRQMFSRMKLIMWHETLILPSFVTIGLQSIFFLAKLKVNILFRALCIVNVTNSPGQSMLNLLMNLQRSSKNWPTKHFESTNRWRWQPKSDFISHRVLLWE